VNGNGNVRTLAEAREKLAGLPSYEPQATDDPVAASEYAVLGTVIQTTAATLAAAAVLEPRHFRDASCYVVFEAALRLAGNGQQVEPASVLSELARDGMLTKIRGPNMGNGGVFLHSLMERAGVIAYHAPRILAAWFQRNLLAELDACKAIAIRRDFDPDEHLDQIRQRIETATALATVTDLRPNSETVTEVLDALEHDRDPGLSTGFPDLDDAIGGLRPGELIIVGARPAQGKTLLGLCIADHVGTHLGLPVLFASLEMREEELTRRRIAAEAKVPLVNLVRHQVTEDEWRQISRVMDRLMDTGLHVDDTSQASPAHIRGRLRAMARTGKAPRLLVIDYLGYMGAPKAESRQQAVAELVRQSKDIAREFDIPVILLAQLNRGPESRSDKRPVPSDLRETGEAEQSADIAILIHREDTYEPESPRAGEVDLVIAKNRQGPLCTVTLTFQGHYGRIVSLGQVPWTASRHAE
jgi:replicative DNA helicase